MVKDTVNEEMILTSFFSQGKKKKIKKIKNGDETEHGTTYTKEQKLFKGFLFHTVNIIEFGIIYLLVNATEILSYHKVRVCL